LGSKLSPFSGNYTTAELIPGILKVMYILAHFYKMFYFFQSCRRQERWSIGEDDNDQMYSLYKMY